MSIAVPADAARWRGGLMLIGSSAAGFGRPTPLRQGAHLSGPALADRNGVCRRALVWTEWRSHHGTQQPYAAGSAGQPEQERPRRLEAGGGRYIQEEGATVKPDRAGAAGEHPPEHPSSGPSAGP